MHCPECGLLVLDGVDECPHCGEDLFDDDYDDYDDWNNDDWNDDAWDDPLYDDLRY